MSYKRSYKTPYRVMVFLLFVNQLGIFNGSGKAAFKSLITIINILPGPHLVALTLQRICRKNSGNRRFVNQQLSSVSAIQKAFNLVKGGSFPLPSLFNRIFRCVPDEQRCRVRKSEYKGRQRAQSSVEEPLKKFPVS